MAVEDTDRTEEVGEALMVGSGPDDGDDVAAE